MLHLTLFLAHMVFFWQPFPLRFTFFIEGSAVAPPTLLLILCQIPHSSSSFDTRLLALAVSISFTFTFGGNFAAQSTMNEICCTQPLD